MPPEAGQPRNRVSLVLLEGNYAACFLAKTTLATNHTHHLAQREILSILIPHSWVLGLPTTSYAKKMKAIIKIIKGDILPLRGPKIY